MYAWAKDEVALVLSVGDLIELARLPGKKGDWYIVESKVLANTAEHDKDGVKVVFSRDRDHKVKGK